MFYLGTGILLMFGLLVGWFQSMNVSDLVQSKYVLTPTGVMHSGKYKEKKKFFGYGLIITVCTQRTCRVYLSSGKIKLLHMRHLEVVSEAR